MYIASDWLEPLGDTLWNAGKNHPGSISMLSDIFNDPIELEVESERTKFVKRGLKDA